MSGRAGGGGDDGVRLTWPTLMRSVSKARSCSPNWKEMASHRRALPAAVVHWSRQCEPRLLEAALPGLCVPSMPRAERWAKTSGCCPRET